MEWLVCTVYVFLPFFLLGTSACENGLFGDSSCGGLSIGLDTGVGFTLNVTSFDPNGVSMTGHGYRTVTHFYLYTQLVYVADTSVTLVSNAPGGKKEELDITFIGWNNPIT
uniref:Uncharacterized protein n=1 Tax=Chromera velia CCMP2878 TaxID=1169474 RepID=A0A0G4IG74_9ALVE|eukprot:Cvel_139.t1-p1 / transcript=Cvel_139.t1 / gene=Cvel_139 / organism=Chromera_velia_CCMP2878 / gene_product=hypothetical protein / transcript_product=hypothetical protein / location=Cvel_scaffold9:217280-217609(-) / protein_length=110 / sequence_SO=supercontig / SO=protein_coding / is_pseudo=false